MRLVARHGQMGGRLRSSFGLETHTYAWDDKLDHHFGAKVLSYVKEDHRETSFALPGEEGIWVGRSKTTPGADIIVSIHGMVGLRAIFWENRKWSLDARSITGTSLCGGS